MISLREPLHQVYHQNHPRRSQAVISWLNSSRSWSVRLTIYFSGMEHLDCFPVSHCFLYCQNPVRTVLVSGMDFSCGMIFFNRANDIRQVDVVVLFCQLFNQRDRVIAF